MTNSLHQARENLRIRLAAIYPGWHLPWMEAAMAASDRVYSARTAAGWEMDDEGGWHAPHPDTGELIREWDWIDLGLDYPEDIK
jgi:hypothetical protein